jgi:hypothetical protein
MTAGRYANVRSQQRYRRDTPCPICNGWPGLPHGQRCWGFLSADGDYARCTRGELAGALQMDQAGGYAHRLGEACRCGLAHGAVIRALPDAAAMREHAAERTEAALKIWDRARSAPGTAVEAYLRMRGLTLPIPSTVRFSRDLRHGPTGSWLPGMVAAVERCGSSRPVAVHRTYLRADGSGKADVEPPRMALGPIAGGAVRCAPATDRLIVAEGIETALTLQQETGQPAWAVLGSSNMPGLVLPPLPLAAEVTIGADPDEAGRQAARRAAARWSSQGRKVRIAVPPGDLDFNDLLRAAAA